MKLTALTSTRATAATAKQIADFRRQGAEPIIVSDRANLRYLERELAPKDYQNAIILKSFKTPTIAADELHRAISKRRLKLSNWVNITDDSTAFFLCACDKIGLDFDFRRAYQRCRLKPVARQILAKAGLDSVRFSVHAINDSKPPREFLFPFIAKPLLGAGSKAVAQISGPKHWRRYLKAMKRDLSPDDISVGGFFPGRQVLVEEILTGQECQLDGFVDKGKVTFCALGVKTAMYATYGYREVRGMLYRPLSLKDSRHHDLHLMRWARQVLQALEFTSGTFHIEAKVNGPEIHLLEVNPRPGGGANVAAIKLLSGIDLIEESLRLWVGLPRNVHAQPKHFSICFAVRYPSKVGTIKRIRKSGTLDRLQTSSNTKLTWYPIYRRNDAIDPREREQYLGILLAPDFCKSLEDMPAATAELDVLVQRSDFVREGGERLD
jgi:biotin carboxylase